MASGLIVEDLPDALQWLRVAMVAAFPTLRIVYADTLASARAACAAERFDIALVDLGLPDGNGVELIAELAPRGTLCVVTTVFSDDAHLFTALQAGAGGYVLKDRDRDSIAELLRGISAGQPPLSPAIARRLLRHFQQPAVGTAPPAMGGGPARALAATTDTDAVRQEVDLLTPREREVLTLIAKGYAVTKVADLLGITYNTAAGYVKAVYRKLNVGSRAEATLEASRRGLVR